MDLLLFAVLLGGCVVGIIMSSKAQSLPSDDELNFDFDFEFGGEPVLTEDIPVWVETLDGDELEKEFLKYTCNPEIRDIVRDAIGVVEGINKLGDEFTSLEGSFTNQVLAATFHKRYRAHKDLILKNCRELLQMLLSTNKDPKKIKRSDLNLQSIMALREESFTAHHTVQDVLLKIKEQLRKENKVENIISRRSTV